MSQITAKAVVNHKSPLFTADGIDQVMVNFCCDYADGANKEWSKYTPSMNFQLCVLPEIAEQFPLQAKVTVTLDVES